MLALIAVSIVGSKIGKESIAVSVELLFVFEAIADVKVSTEEMEKDPRIAIEINMDLFSIRLPTRALKKI